MEVNPKLYSITHVVSKVSTGSAEGKSEKVTYYRGDPEFDEYESNMKAMVSTELTLPKNFTGPGALCSLGDASDTLSNQIHSVFERYHRGNADMVEVERVLSRTVADIRSTYADLGFDPKEFTSKLIEDVYGLARFSNIQGAKVASWYEGQSIAQVHNGHDRNTKDWVYYNADYYYASEKMKDSLQDMVRKIGAKYGITELDLPTEYPDGDVRKGVYSSYNTAICDGMRNQSWIGSIVDETVAPPPGLKFFYMDKQGSDPLVAQLPGPKNDPYAAFDSFLSVSYGSWSYTGRVPVRMDGAKFPISVNMLDVVNYGTGGRVPKEIRGFLKNVDFFSIIQGGPYKSSHPRKY